LGRLLRRGERRLTRIAIFIVWLFLSCHLLRVVPTAWEALYGEEALWPAWMNFISDLSHLLVVVNSAVNFLLYTLL